MAHPAITMLCDLLDDVDALLATGITGVPHIVATHQLLRLATTVDTSDIRSRSLASLTDSLEGLLATRVAALRHGVARATVDDAPITLAVVRACRDLNAAVTLPERSGADHSALLERITALSLSGATTASLAAHESNQSLFVPVPILKSQPEWGVLATAASTRTAATVATLHPELESLEQFVMEAVYADLWDSLRQLASDDPGTPTSELITFRAARPAGSQARRRTWPRLHLSWILSALDTGLIGAWPSTVTGRTVTICVPSTVAHSAAYLAREGWVSAVDPGNDIDLSRNDRQ
jgi:hypothetical protein